MLTVTAAYDDEILAYPNPFDDELIIEQVIWIKCSVLKLSVL
jgi:hypothetical protein